MRKVNPKDYTFTREGDSCYLMHKSGKGGFVGCGTHDTVEVFSKGGKICVLSVNYDQNYAAIECFEDGMGASSICFFDSKDIQRHLGDMGDLALAEIAELLHQQC